MLEWELSVNVDQCIFLNTMVPNMRWLFCFSSLSI